MKSEIRTIIAIFLICVLLAVAGFYLRNINSGEKILSPFSSSLDIFTLFESHKKPQYIVYGYMPYWTLESSKHFHLDKLTHIAYFGMYLNGDGTFEKTAIGEDGYKIAEPGYRNWNENKELDRIIEKSKREGVRFALTVIAHEDESNDEFLNCRECWPVLLENLKTELDKKDITDANLNFEYVEQTDEASAVKFAEFTKYINEELDKIYGDSFVVVSAFADSAKKPRISSKLNELGRYSDGIFIMAYDFHRPESDYAGPVAPLSSNKDETVFESDSESNFNLNSMLRDFLSQIAPNKLILGVPYYGYNWVVESDEPKAKRIQGTDEIGFSQSQLYDQIMEDIKELGVQVKWDENAQVPYYSYISPETGSIRQVYFENAQSLGKKYDLVKENNLAGAGIWALGYDGDRPELWNLIFEKFVR